MAEHQSSNGPALISRRAVLCAATVVPASFFVASCGSSVVGTATAKAAPIIAKIVYDLSVQIAGNSLADKLPDVAGQLEKAAKTLVGANSPQNVELEPVAAYQVSKGFILGGVTNAAGDVETLGPYDHAILLTPAGPYPMRARAARAELHSWGHLRNDDGLSRRVADALMSPLNRPKQLSRRNFVVPNGYKWDNAFSYATSRGHVTVAHLDARPSNRPGRMAVMIYTRSRSAPFRTYSYKDSDDGWDSMDQDA